MKIAVAQIDIKWECSHINMRKIEELVDQASKKNVDLILFPEMSLTGFTMNIDKLPQSELQIINWIEQVAHNKKINIGLGFAIKINNKGINRYAIISKEGEKLINYTKLHPFSYGKEDTKYYKGIDILSCKISEFEIAPFICYDLRFPEIFQIASKEAELITIAANWPKSREDHWIALLRARAIENQCYIIGINRVGEGGGIEYNGASLFINPNGDILNEISNKEELIIKDIDINEVKRVRDMFNLKKDRREQLYYSYVNFKLKNES